MVLTIATLEKLFQNDLISLFVERNDKLKDTIIELGNKLAKVSKTLERMESQQAHCVKSIQIWSFFWSVFSRIGTEYGDLLYKSPYSVQIGESTD